MTPVARTLAGKAVCALCGHVPACGSATAWYEDRVPVALCHVDSHSCYHRWTVYGERPT